jgi:hypothetical protein
LMRISDVEIYTKLCRFLFASLMLFRVNCSNEYLRGFASVDDNLDSNFRWM